MRINKQNGGLHPIAIGEECDVRRSLDKNLNYLYASSRKFFMIFFFRARVLVTVLAKNGWCRSAFNFVVIFSLRLMSSVYIFFRFVCFFPFDFFFLF